MDLSRAQWAGENWKEDLDRLVALQKQPDETKTNLEKQEEFILQTHMHPMSCPLCASLVGSKDNEIVCPTCLIGLVRVVPFVKVTEPGWHWTLHEDARKKLYELWDNRET